MSKLGRIHARSSRRFIEVKNDFINVSRNFYDLPIGLFLLVACLAASAQTVAIAERPTLSPGDTWTYRVLDGWSGVEQSQSTRTFLEKNGDRLKFSRTNDPSDADSFENLDLNPCRSLKNSTDVTCAGPFSFPLTVGQKIIYENQVFSNKLGHAAGTCIVKVIEKVTVPAGIFDTFRIDCDEQWIRKLEGSGGGTTKYTLWYSPIVKRSVKSHVELTWNSKLQNKQINELVSFKIQ
jgi:hypothetical protein